MSQPLGAASFAAAGAQEEAPSGWDIVNDKAQGKDILNTVHFTDDVGGKIFLYAGFESDTNGSTNLSIELNQVGTLFNNGHDNVPFRSENDLLITFDHSGSNPKAEIGLCFWHGNNLAGEWRTEPSTGNPPVPQGVPIGGSTNCSDLDQAGYAKGSVNSLGALTNVKSTLSVFNDTIAEGDFGELEVSLTDALSGAAQSCFDFGGIWLHSRSSDQPNSTMQDYVIPATLVGAANCTASLTVQKQTDPADSGSDQFGFSTTGQPDYLLDTNAASAATSSKTFSYTAGGQKVIHEGTLPTGWHLGGITCVDPLNASPVDLQFSSTGTTNDFHNSFAAGDTYARFSLTVGQ